MKGGGTRFAQRTSVIQCLLPVEQGNTTTREKKLRRFIGSLVRSRVIIIQAEESAEGRSRTTNKLWTNVLLKKVPELVCEVLDIGLLKRYGRPLPVMHEYDRLLIAGGAQ